MALYQEMLDVFVRLSDVERVYPGGLAGYREHMGEVLGVGVWHDDHLLREGAMSGADVEQIITGWEELGLHPFRTEQGEPVEWLECCVSSRYMDGPTLPCTWLAFDPATGGAYLAGQKPGALVGPNRR